MNTTYTIPEAFIPAGADERRYAGDERGISSKVLTWILVLPLLFYAVQTQPSFLNANNSEFMTTNGPLVQPQQGIRPQVVISMLYFYTLIGFGFPSIWRSLQRNKMQIACLLFAACSALWSASAVLSLRSTIDLAVTVFVACYISERLSPERLMRTFILIGVVAAVSSILTALLLPKFGIFHRYGGGAWQGIFSHKNTLGLAMAQLLTPAFFVRMSGWKRGCYAAMLIFLIVMSQSRGAWVVTALLLVFMGWMWAGKVLERRLFQLLSLVSVAMTGVITAVVMTHSDALIRALGKDPSMSGRTDIYSLAFHALLQRPLLGYGYCAFWVPTNVQAENIRLQLNWPGIGYAENGFLELGLQLGFVGIGLIVFLMLRAGWQAYRISSTEGYNPRVCWYVSLLFFELVTNIDAGIVFAPGNLYWLLTVVAFLGLSAEYRKSAAPRIAEAQQEHVTVHG